jgi:hypothetical protein
MATDAEIDAAADAIKERAYKFESPVYLYVEREAEDRFTREHGVAAAWDKREAGFDFEKESWRLLARAALAAAEQVREPRGPMVKTSDFDSENPGSSPGAAAIHGARR